MMVSFIKGGKKEMQTYLALCEIKIIVPQV